MILGLWVIAEGVIYDMFTDANLYNDNTRPEGCKAAVGDIFP